MKVEIGNKIYSMSGNCCYGENEERKGEGILGWLCCPFKRALLVRAGLSDEVTAEQTPAGGDVEHGLDLGHEGRTFQAKGSGCAKASRQRPLFLG